MEVNLLPAPMPAYCGGVEELMESGPGAIFVLMHHGETGITLELSVICPGCGRESYRIGHPQYIVSGLEAPTVDREITFVPCCGWTGFLMNGIWRS